MTRNTTALAVVMVLLCLDSLAAKTNVYFDGVRPDELPEWIAAVPRGQADWVVRARLGAFSYTSTQSRATQAAALLGGLGGALAGGVIGRAVAHENAKGWVPWVGAGIGMVEIGSLLGGLFLRPKDGHGGYVARQSIEYELTSLKSAKTTRLAVVVESMAAISTNSFGFAWWAVGLLTVGAMHPLTYVSELSGRDILFERYAKPSAFDVSKWDDALEHPVASAAIADELVRCRDDHMPPELNVSSSAPGGSTVDSLVRIGVRTSDDVGLGELEVKCNGTRVLRRYLDDAPEFVFSVDVPLRLGENSIAVSVDDWSSKLTTKSVSLFRRRPSPGDSADKAGGIPELFAQVQPLDGNNTVVGGREEGVKVTVTNNGKGVAKWVRVVLEGDELLTKQWGSERNLEDIKPGDSKTATFSLLMPTELERRQAKLRVVVKEGRGYSPTDVPELTLNLVPADLTSRPVEVVEDVDNDVPRTGIQRPNGYALVVGLSQYQSVTAPKHARKDAETFAKYVTGAFGISQLKTLYDDRATSATVKANLTDWLKKKHGFKVIYFAGHGVPDPENPRSGGVCVLPYDGDPELKSTLIPVSDLAELGANPDDTVIVFIDACYSGEGRTVELASRPLVLAEIPETKAITFAAAEGSQPSKEFEKAQHGYFTYYTLLGLKGKADANNDGWVTTTELYNYVKKNVSDATNEVQVPVLKGAREMRLAKVR
ncbi:MAG: caspase family protein [candidate division WOR-3 bacterium]|nr:caspase family protein [candidate division WOR-3 bacterium]